MTADKTADSKFEPSYDEECCGKLQKGADFTLNLSRYLDASHGWPIRWLVGLP